MAYTPEQIQQFKEKYGVTSKPTIEPVRATTASDRINALRRTAGISEIPTRESTFLEKTGDVFKAVGGAFIEGEKKFGESITASLATYAPSLVGVKDLEKSQAQDIQTQKQIMEQIKQGRAQGKDVSRWEKLLQSQAAQPKQTVEKMLPAVTKTPGQVFGEAGRVALDAAMFGTVSKGAQTMKLVPKLSTAEKILKAKDLAHAKDLYDALSTGQKALSILKTTGKAVAQQAPLGYGFDVTSKLMEGKTGKEALTPGLGTGLGVAIPTAIGGFQLLGLARKPVARLIESKLIKPNVSDVKFGKDPAGAAIEFIKPANNWDDYVRNAYEGRRVAGQKITDLADKAGLTGKVKVSISGDDLKELDDLIKVASNTNDETLLRRAINGKKALTDIMVAEADDAGALTGRIISKSKAKLDDLTIPEILDFKRKIGDMTSKWTGNPSVDKPFDRAIKTIYGRIKGKLENAVSTADPAVGKEFARLNEKYGSINSAVIAIQRQADKVATGGMPFGEAVRALGAAGAGAAATGPWGLLAGAGLYGLEEMAKKPMVMSRLAKALYGGGPGLVEKLYQSNPKLANGIYKLFVKENLSIDNAVRETIKETFENAMKNPKGGFIKIGEEASSKLNEKGTVIKAIKDALPILQQKNPEAWMELEEISRKTALTTDDLNRAREVLKLNGKDIGQKVAKVTPEEAEKYEGLLRTYKYAASSDDIKKAGERLIKELDSNPAAKAVAEMSRESLKDVKYLYRHGDESGISYSTQPLDYFEKKGSVLIKIPVTKEVLDRVVYSDRIADRLSEIPGFTSTVSRGKIISSLPNSGEMEVILRPLNKVEPLIAEAKKYKSPEEFIKAQREVKNVPISDITGIKGAKNQTIKEYNPESVKFAEQQIKSGKAEPIQVSINAEGKLRLENGEHRIEAYNNLGIKDVPIKIIEDFRTGKDVKSQLTDIWKQANKVEK